MKKKVQKTQKNQKVEKGQNFGKKSGRCKMFSFSFSLFLSPGLFLWGLFFPSLEPERGRSLRDRGLDTESRKTLWGLTGLGWEFRAPRTDLKKKSGKMQSVFGRFRQVEFLCLIVSHWGPLSVFRSVTFFVLKKKKYGSRAKTDGWKMFSWSSSIFVREWVLVVSLLVWGAEHPRAPPMGNRPRASRGKKVLFLGLG